MVPFDEFMWSREKNPAVELNRVSHDRGLAGNVRSPSNFAGMVRRTVLAVGAGLPSYHIAWPTS